MSNVSKTRVLMVFDETSELEVATIKLHVVADEFIVENESNEKYVTSSIWKNKNYDFSTLRVEEDGKTYFDYQEGQSVSAKDIEDEVAALNDAGGNTYSATII
jgi:hypothetical protein